LGVDSSMEGHVTSYSSQRVDGQSSNPEVGDGSTGHHDVHDDTLVYGECQGERPCSPTS
jgi:hypothetical protein